MWRGPRYTEMDKRRAIFTILLGIVAALILWVAILGRETQVNGVMMFRLFHTFTSFQKDTQWDEAKENLLGNILLFLPVGILVPLVSGWKKWYKTALISFGSSLLIEIVQLITKRGYFDPDDVVFNVTGAMIGYVLLKSVCLVCGQDRR